MQETPISEDDVAMRVAGGGPESIIPKIRDRPPAESITASAGNSGYTVNARNPGRSVYSFFHFVLRATVGQVRLGV